MNDYLDRNGIVDGRGKPRDLLALIATATNSCARLLNDLGCSPTSRARLGLDIARAGQSVRDHLLEHYGTRGEGDA
jgi:hypothetical protein